MEKLNDKQLEAVTTTEGYLRVIAGAGSGKTKMLVNRYVYIIRELGISTKNILCITFSNKAANEMKERIKKILAGEPDVSFITTYHGLGARIIRENVDKMFFPDNFQIIDQTDQKQILSEIYDELDLKLDNGSFEAMITAIGIYKANLKYIDEMINTKNDNLIKKTPDLDKEIIRKYLLKQKRSYLVDFEDLINYPLYLLRKYKDVRDKWQEKLNYILVDEFQDSAEKESEIIDLISDKYKNVMIVGDPDQNIYEWRGSSIEVLLDYDIKHVPTKTVVMNQNYRSTAKILNCANQLIKNNKNRFEKDLFTEKTDGDDVLYYCAKNDYDEADWVTSRIKLLHDTNMVNYKDIAVLYRSSFSSRIVEKKLIDANIPYEIIGNVKFFQRMEIKDILAYMRLIVFNDDMSLKRIINKPKRRFGKIKMNKLMNMQNANVPLFEVLQNNIHVLGNSDIDKFVSVINDLRNRKDLSNAALMFDSIMEETGYEQYIRELGNLERLNNLVEFKRVIMDLLADSQDLLLEDAINYFALQTDYEEEEIDNVKLMTIHASKGLEFNNVFVIGLVEGNFPSQRTLEARQIDGLEEERRLCYVALTRARERLFLTSSNNFVHEGSSKKVSRFIEEIGENNYTLLGVKQKGDSITYETKYNVGDTVIHRLLGPGEIIDIDYKNSSYKIKFDKLEFPRQIDMNYTFTQNENDTSSSTSSKISIDENKFYISMGIDLEEDSNLPLIDDTEELEEESEYEEYNDNEVTLNDVQEGIIVNDDANIYEVDFEDKKYDIVFGNENNLWYDPNVPKVGWSCVGICDLGYQSKICAMCGVATIRYVHYMKHPNYPYVLGVGCICASKMEIDETKATEREKEFKNRINRRNSFLNKKWNLSSKGHPYIKYKNDLFLMYYIKDEDKWALYINGALQSKQYSTREEIDFDVFEYIENKKIKK